EDRATLLRFVQARDLMELARRAASAVLQMPGLSPCPPLDFAEVYQQVDQAGRDNISKSQAELREWEGRFVADWEYLRWPVCFTAANARFTQLWQEKFAPLRKWICDAATCVAAEVQHDYLDFRLDHGLVTYGDQIALAEELLKHPVAAQRIREENFRVILDEAQDTEPLQFSVLLEATRPPEARGLWLRDRHLGPRPGHFCMVGDFQQSIYWQRADLNYYRAVHEALIADKHGESLEFAVTFRLVGWPVTIQSERDVKGGSPAYAWLTAVVTIMTDPLNAYEIVGVLREIFSASYHDLAVFSEGQKVRFRIDEILSATGRISTLLRTLAEIRQRAEGLTLFDAVTLIIEQTQLRERLLLLPATEFGDLARELDASLAQAAEAEANGMILAEFAEHLRNDFAAPRAVHFSADDNAIQLITSHKAKGSE